MTKQNHSFEWIFWIPSLFSIIIFLIIRPSTSSDPSDQQKAKKVVRWQQPHSQVQVQVDYFSKNNSFRLDCYLWEEQLASTGLRSITLWLWPLAINIWKWFKQESCHFEYLFFFFFFYFPSLHSIHGLYFNMRRNWRFGNILEAFVIVHVCPCGGLQCSLMFCNDL